MLYWTLDTLVRNCPRPKLILKILFASLQRNCLLVFFFSTVWRLQNASAPVQPRTRSRGITEGAASNITQPRRLSAAAQGTWTADRCGSSQSGVCGGRARPSQIRHLQRSFWPGIACKNSHNSHVTIQHTALSWGRVSGRYTNGPLGQVSHSKLPYEFYFQ